ncbi:molecular chaperone TorD [Actinobacillus succinogenes]|uniref:Glycoside hydrolase family 20 n=1 Tax=Actinobacillus succinogenes (strain ATCC 55618 / DSM 22257 / CCUG 43843 / 130Z) TaxID=339671 RepID=A6VMN2_ACTSZ|nr:family 20 glycosylhydrolase [Actinobacillus succinogenes]ABR74229.1 glycoside hydrolase family 20 [Actinobacillus succinogenes 130Z]PHI39342.1 molecular chaperone TorD [Actinobacillus succinogenes]
MPDSSRKVRISLIFALMMGLGLNSVSARADENDTAILQLQQTFRSAELSQNKETGLALDIARHFYPVEVIKAFIDTIHNAGGTFLHLHFSDHENYALESTVLNQRAENATRDKYGVYINPKTHKPFLSYAQLKDITDYAKNKNVELVPELDSPNHMTAIFDLLEKERGKPYTQQLRSKWTDEEIDITNPDSIAFIKSLIAEVIEIFGDSSRHFHIGGDEFGYGTDNNHEFITYVNTLAEFLQQKGLKTRIWNDGLIKATIHQLNPDIQITYWSYDGNPQDEQEERRRREIRMSMPELIAQGFAVLNYNAYYLYFTPQEDATTSHDSNFATRDVLKNWDLTIWDGQNSQNKIRDRHKIMGSALSIWGEKAGSLRSDSIQKYTAPLLTAIIYKSKITGEHDKTNRHLYSLTENDFASLHSTTYIDLLQLSDNEFISLKNHRQTVRLLQENQLVERKISFWLNGSDKHQIRLNGNWYKTEKTQQRDGKSYQAYDFQGNTLWLDKEITVSTP